MAINTTEREYRAFQKAYSFFNKELFGGSLPEVLITLQRHAKAMGYFKPDSFTNRVEENTAHELAMNPDHFNDSTDEDILSTLVHEMAHVWQQHEGTPPRRGYHDREWAAKMREIGLYPSSTAEKGGKEVGQRMSHYITLGGPYAVAYRKLAATGFQLNWQSQVGSSKESGGKGASKTKYTCGTCGLNAWAKPKVLLFCGFCLGQGSKPAPMRC